jgi:hypothetical protein
MPHDQHRGAAALGKAHQRGRAFAQLGDRAGGIGHAGQLHGLDGIDHQQRRLLCRGHAKHRVEVCLGRHLHALVGAAQPPRPQRHLRRGLLASGVEHGMPGRQRAGHLQQQRGLADARFAAQQGHRARHQATAQHPVQFSHSQAEAPQFITRCGCLHRLGQR